MSYTIYTMCNDDRLISLCTLLESNRCNDNWDIKVIPFDDNIKYMHQLSEIYSFEIVSTDKKWDDLGKAIFKDEEYRSGLYSWRYFRKFNVFNEDDEDFIFLDSNVIICDSLYPVCELNEPNTFVFGVGSRPKRNFEPWFQFVLSRMNPKINEGFNAGFWSSNSNVFSKVNFRRLTGMPSFRLGLTVSPEQSFLSMLVALYGCSIKLVQDELDVYPVLSGDNKFDNKLDWNRGKIYFNKKKVLTVKWNGSYFSNNNEIPNAYLLKEPLESAIQEIKADKHLYDFICGQMEILGIE